MDNSKEPEKSAAEISDEKKDDPGTKPNTGFENEHLSKSPKVALKELQAEGETKADEEERVQERDGDVEKNPEEIRDPEDEAAPQIHYTLESLSEELDQFLSALSSPKTQTNGNDEDVDYLQIPQTVGKFLDLVEEKVAKYDSGESKMKCCLVPEENTLLLEAVDRVSNLLRSLMEIKSCLDHHGPLINQAGEIQQRAMAFLEDEFRFLLEDSGRSAREPDHDDSHQKKGDHKSTNTAGQDHKETDPRDLENSEIAPDDIGINYPGYTEEIVSILKKIADQMTKGGYGAECREVYLVGRKNTLMQTLKDQEFEKVSIDEVQKMNWETLEREILIWNKTFKDCSMFYFPGELKLAEQVFPMDHGSLFDIITHSLSIQLLGFAEAVAMTKRSTERLFKILDIYETLRDNFPAMKGHFREERWSELKTEVTRAHSRLGETAISIFSDLANSIRSDSGKTPVPGGAVHPLTRYTMNYLKYSCEYKDTLEQVFDEHSKIERADSTSRPRNYQGGEDNQDCNTNSGNSNNRNGTNENDNENGSPFSCQLMRIMDHLDANLEAKSKLYRDVSLSCIFMMNNGRYIVQKIKGSPEIHQVMGDTWCRRRSSNLRTYHKNYQRETWGRLLGCLGHEGLMNNGKIVKPNLKERFKSFNAMFDEINKTQSTWVVNDEQLQSELRVSITAVIIPAYRSFLARFSQFLDPGRQTEKYIKYQPEDIEDLIDKLFDGNASSSTMSRRRT